MSPYEVWYINKTGKHVMRKVHDTLMSALRHSINLGGIEVTEDGGLVSYIKDASTGLIAKGDHWVQFKEVFK